MWGLARPVPILKKSPRYLEITYKTKLYSNIISKKLKHNYNSQINSCKQTTLNLSKKNKRIGWKLRYRTKWGLNKFYLIWLSSGKSLVNILEELLIKKSLSNFKKIKNKLELSHPKLFSWKKQNLIKINNNLFKPYSGISRLALLTGNKCIKIIKTSLILGCSNKKKLKLKISINACMR